MKTIIFIVLFVLITPLVSAEEHFENNDVVLVGYCRTIFGWKGGLYRGYIKYPCVDVNYKQMQFLSIRVYKNNVLIYKNIRNNVTVFMKNATGLFFWSNPPWSSFGLFPSIVFVKCFADETWVRWV